MHPPSKTEDGPGPVLTGLVFILLHKVSGLGCGMSLGRGREGTLALVHEQGLKLQDLGLARKCFRKKNVI